MTETTPAQEGAAVRPPYDLSKLVFIWLVHIISLTALVLWYQGTLAVSWRSLLLALIWFAASSTAITAGYHRLFAHITYRASRILEVFYLLAGAAAVQGSVLQWSAQHRDHHSFTDHSKDPYNIQLGFWFAHIGWVVRQTNPNYERVRDLQKDPLIRFQHRYFGPMAAITSFVLPFAIGYLWQEAVGALLIAGFVRLTIQWHMTFCVNSVAHYYGSQKYSTRHSARGSWWLSFLVWGEMDHNYHHSFPNDFRTGTCWWDFDPGKWWIFICSKIGLASDLKKADPERIQRAVAGARTNTD